MVNISHVTLLIVKLLYIIFFLNYGPALCPLRSHISEGQDWEAKHL